MAAGKSAMCLLCLLYIVSNIPTVTSTLPQDIIDTLPLRCYSNQGDINIGYLYGISSQDHTVHSMIKCRGGINKLGLWYGAMTEVVKYMTDFVNVQSDLLFNLTLGFTIVDDCNQHMASLAVSNFFLPGEQNIDLKKVMQGDWTTCSDGYPLFPITGVIGPITSFTATMVSPLLSLYQIPNILPYASSDQLSDKSCFAYATRLVPPDSAQTKAMIDLVIDFEWSYISIIFAEGAYGENGARHLKREAKKRGICIAFSYMTTSDMTSQDAVKAIDKLIKFKDACVVLYFSYFTKTLLLKKELENRGFLGHFIVIFSDATKVIDMGRMADSAIGLSFIEVDNNKDFYTYFQSLVPERTHENPWMQEFWEAIYDCHWKHSSENSCYDIIGMPSNLGKLARIPDAINVYVHALHNLIKDICPEVSLRKAAIKDCITGPQLLKYIRETSMEGYTGFIQFDQNGDSIPKYQFQKYDRNTGQEVTLAYWEKKTGIQYVQNKSIWLNVNNSEDSFIIPESVCSHPCEDKEYYIEKELHCCWECHKCRNNEILVDNKTGCETCPLTMWPDVHTATICLPIPPTVLELTSVPTLILACLAMLGILLTIFTAIIFFHKQTIKIIKASSIHLMSVILFGTFIAYITIISLLLQPSTYSCYVNRFGFNLAVSLIYAPLMTKTNRIYRIFSAGKSNKRAILMSTRSQMVIVITCVLLELILCIVSVVIAPPDPITRMQVPTEKHTEIMCSLPLTGLLAPLAVNLIYIFICAICGFMVRKLPDNFNQSWYIFVSVATTAFLWLVFLPAYFTAFYAIYQVVLLASCLVLNASLTLICLYLPKIYFIYFMDESALHTGSTVTSVVAPTGSSTVHPHTSESEKP